MVHPSFQNLGNCINLVFMVHILCFIGIYTDIHNLECDTEKLEVKSYSYQAESEGSDLLNEIQPLTTKFYSQT